MYRTPHADHDGMKVWLGADEVEEFLEHYRGASAPRYNGGPVTASSGCKRLSRAFSDG